MKGSQQTLLFFVTLAKAHGNNCSDQKVNFVLQNALDVTCVHLPYKNFSQGNTPDPNQRGKGREGRDGQEGRERWDWGGKGWEVHYLSQILDMPLHVGIQLW